MTRVIKVVDCTNIEIKVGSTSLMIMGGDSCSRGREFPFQLNSEY